MLVEGIFENMCTGMVIFGIFKNEKAGIVDTSLFAIIYLLKVNYRTLQVLLFDEYYYLQEQ